MQILSIHCDGLDANIVIHTEENIYIAESMYLGMNMYNHKKLNY